MIHADEKGTVFVCDPKDCLTVEVARDETARRRGLQRRTALPSDEGMLFVFDHAARHAFWMKDTWIPLDMIWLDKDGTIVDLIESVPPCMKEPCPIYRPKNRAWMVLEVAAGVAAQRGWMIGTKLDIKDVVFSLFSMDISTMNRKNSNETTGP